MSSGGGIGGTTLIGRLLARDMSLLEGYTPYSKSTTRGPDTDTTSALQRELDDIDMENPQSLYLILSAIQQSQFVEAVPWILDMLLSQGPEGDSYCDPEARLFMHAELPLEMLTFVADSAPSRFSLAAVIDSLISLDSTDEVYDACRKTLRVLGDTDFPSWISFANEADFQGNGMVWFFCQHQARRTAPFTPRPPYMREVTSRTLQESSAAYETQYQKDITKLRAESSSSELSEDEVATMIAEIAKARSEDPELFRVWGPSNLKLLASDEEVLDGSADLRMFIDDRFTPEEQGTWFTGSCDRCWFRIPSSRYATRKPIEGGGWRGQYCSWDCVRLDCEPYEATAKEMTFFYSDQCDKYGVYDHLFVSGSALLGERGDPDDDTAPLDRPIVVS